MRGGREATWKVAFILGFTECENENVSNFINMNTCEPMRWTLHRRRAVECLCPAHTWPRTGNCSCAFIHRVGRNSIWLPAVSPKEKKGVGLGSQSLWPTSRSSQQSWRGGESRRWYCLFKARGDSHLPSVALRFGFVQRQRSSSVLTTLRNCYPAPLSALQKQSTAGVNSFHSSRIINCQLNSRSRATYKISSAYTWKLVDVNQLPWLPKSVNSYAHCEKILNAFAVWSMFSMTWEFIQPMVSV